MITNVYPDADVQLLERKGVICYDYINSFARLDEPALPPRDGFFNKLGNVECSTADYSHALHVWDNFHCSSLKKYITHYIWSVRCLLADVFQAFQNQSLNEFQLDPA